MSTIRVLIADDHPVARTGLCNVLNGVTDIEVVGEAGDGVESLRLVDELIPDILILDMEMPKIKGLDVARQLRASGSSVRIVAFSAHNDKEYISGLLASGASGYLTKGETPQMIIETVRGVARGEQGWISREIAAQMATWTTEQPQRSKLTPREAEVLRLVVDGKTNQGIGLVLGISEKTVEKHLEGVFAKLKVSSRVKAAVQAVKEGLM